MVYNSAVCPAGYCDCSRAEDIITTTTSSRNTQFTYTLTKYITSPIDYGEYNRKINEAKHDYCK